MKHDEGPPITPTEHLVRTAIKEFDEENAVIEEALKDLFGQYSDNKNHSHVLLKVVALNRLYSTNIFAVHNMAKHIYDHAEEIDSALVIGSPEIVDKIARLTIKAEEHHFYSFATKYCSWHRTAAYPIWDSRVDRYLWRLQKRDHFAPSFKANADLWDYPKFRAVVISLRDRYGLGSFTVKQIDKFLGLYGGKSSGMAATQS